MLLSKMSSQILGQGENIATKKIRHSHRPQRIIGTSKTFALCLLPYALFLEFRFNQIFGNLHGVQSGALADLVANAPEGDSVGVGNVGADIAASTARILTEKSPVKA